MNPAIIAALVAGGQAIVELVQKLEASRAEDQAAVAADLKSEVDKMKSVLDANGAVDQAFAADDAELDGAIADAAPLAPAAEPAPLPPADTTVEPTKP